MGSLTSANRKIDVHAHFLPTCYVEELRQAGISHPDGMRGYPEWSVESALETYDRLGIATGILSLSSPGVYFGDVTAAVRLARRANEEGAEVVKRHPTRFGLFADLPLPDVPASLTEIAYALDTLGADGIALKTNVRGVYLGDKLFDVIFEELNFRRAVIFIHPTSPTCWRQCSMDFPRSMLEFPFETTRAVTNLILSGTLKRFPKVQIILPHNGGAVPMLAERIATIASSYALGPAANEDIRSYLRRLYYDTAMATSQHTLATLLNIVDPSHILYGSDTPWLHEELLQSFNRQLAESRLITDFDREGIYRRNASSLFNRLLASNLVAL
jgi:6-methylsalicylate decarboxylase